MEDNKGYSYGIEGGSLNFGIDPNKDGENVLSGKVHLNEAMQEVISKGEAVEGVKVASFKLDLTKLKIIIDSDKDGQPVLELEIDLAEAIDESGLLK